MLRRTQPPIPLRVRRGWSGTRNLGTGIRWGTRSTAFGSACIVAVPRLAALAALAWVSYGVHLLTGDPLLMGAGRLAEELINEASWPVAKSGLGNGEKYEKDKANVVRREPIVIRTDLSDVGPLEVWDSILRSTTPEGDDDKRKVVVEVGVHTPTQCVAAATLGYILHCFEPSPNSYERLEKGVLQAPPGVPERIHPHQQAAGPASGTTVPFHSTGGTGDHVGEYDMWRMEKRRPDPPEEGESLVDRKKRGTIINVPTIRLDDFIAEDVAGVDGSDAALHLLKVDTQGFEPAIFSGLVRSVQNAAIDYIIFEFWPRGMDLMSDTMDQCSGHKVLDELADAGYELYALGVESHPKAPLMGGVQLRKEAATRPFDGGTEAYCRWFFELEKKYPSLSGKEEYKFGYWSGFLAVAPGKTFPDTMKKKLRMRRQAPAKIK